MSTAKLSRRQGNPKQKKSNEPTLDTADDYQAAGVDYEEAAGKHRAGDIAKSMRFFQRAIDVYDEGLRRFPQSFDLAYNKARVQYEIATHPALVRQLPGSLTDALDVALLSHKYALSLNQDDADLLFNTSQVLTSIAEETAKDQASSIPDALQLLEQALELQARCLALQELQYEQSQAQNKQIAGLDEPARPETSPVPRAPPPAANDQVDSESNVESEEEQWASIIEPVTHDSLIDTALAQLGTLATLCSILGSAADDSLGARLPAVEDLSNRLLNGTLPQYTPGTPMRLAEIALAKANLASHFLEAAFHFSRIDAQTYKRERDNAFDRPELSLPGSPTALLANAVSLITFNAALVERPTLNHTTENLTRWNSLNAAIASLATASKLPDIADDLPKTHFLRGDCSLLQYQLSRPPSSYPPATKAATQLLRNAQTFYRNAAKLSHQADEKDVAVFRETVVTDLLNGSAPVWTRADVPHERRDWVQEQVEEMAGEGLLSAEMIAASGGP